MDLKVGQDLMEGRWIGAKDFQLGQGKKRATKQKRTASLKGEGPKVEGSIRAEEEVSWFGIPEKSVGGGGVTRQAKKQKGETGKRKEHQQKNYR